jgi:hypothetical protein
MVVGGYDCGLTARVNWYDCTQSFAHPHRIHGNGNTKIPAPSKGPGFCFFTLPNKPCRMSPVAHYRLCDVATVFAARAYVAALRAA